MTRRTGPLHGVAATLIVAACGPSPAPRAVTKVSLLGAPELAVEAFPTPAAWRYQPREAATLLSRLTLPGGGTLFAGNKGERWLVGPHSEIAEAAPELAPETLVAIVSSGDGGFLFLGQSGTSYEAREPLGPFVKSSAPLEPLVHVSAAGKVLVGVRLDGAIVRSDTAGGAWSRVGPESERFQDVALLPDGRGLALAVPEGYWETRDYAATFTRLETTTLGSLSLAVDATAGLVVKTVQGPYRWDPGAASPSGPFVKASGPLSPPVQSLGVALPIGPSAAALAEGRAIALRDQWLELRATSASSFSLVRGAFGAPFTRSAFPLANGCADARLAGNARALYVACARDKSNVTQPIEVHRSFDDGATWKIEPYVVEGRLGELSMAVAGDGALVVSGVCGSALRGPGCAPAGIHRRDVVPTDSGSGIDLAAAATPSLAGSALGLVTSLDGRVVYALGRRSKGETLAVFVSRDGGATFDARDVEGLVVPDDEGRMRGQTPSVVLESTAAAEDGTVAFVVLQGRKRAWLVVDEDGRTLALAKPPVEGARLGAVGQRGLAVNMASREAWESLDGGATFASLGKLPVDPCPGMADCSAKIACVARGCVLGDIVSRVGFRAAPRAPLLAPPSADRGHARAEPHVATPLSCTLDPGEWRRFPSTLGPPSADQAAIGRLAWFVLRHDFRTASVSVQGPRLGPPATGRKGPNAIEEVTLLSPAPRGADVAYTASVQIEGVAALRYPLPGTKGSRDPDLRNLEVAWDDLLFGNVGHAIIPDGGPYRPGDYGDKGSPRFASPALVSIASGGVYVRPHRSLGDDQPTYFVDGHSVEVVPPVPWPAEMQRRGRTEMTRVDGAHTRTRTHVPIRIDDGTVVRARKVVGGSWAFDAVSMGFADPRLFARTEHANIAYVAAAAGLHLQTTDERARESVGLLYPFRADGAVLDAPTHVPTAADLPATPRPCSAGDRGATPRVVVPFQPGTRHPIIVTDAIEPLRVLLTDSAVLHGTPESPCAVAFDTEFVSSEATTPGITEQAVVFVDPAERSWLFRSPSGAREPTTGFEVRSMTCRFDAAAEVPIEVFRMKGTLVPPR